ncbi:TPA: ribonuclease PH [bacterium]|nr:ribonuclease PH [bacterium]
MRKDGRKDYEVRPVKFTLNYIDYVQSSVLIEIGKTKVICCASCDEKVPSFLKDTDTGWITAEYSLLPFSCKERVERESHKGKLEGRTREIERTIGRVLRSVVNLRALGERRIIIDCDCLQADGGTRCASITGGFCALYLAIKDLMKKNILKTNPIQAFVSAISVGVVDGEELIDLTYEEDKRASCDLNLAMTDNGKIVEIQATAEGVPFSIDSLNRFIELGKNGIERLIEHQKKILLND